MIDRISRSAEKRSTHGRLEAAANAVGLSAGRRLIQRRGRKLSSEAGRRLHLTGEFVVADRPRVPDGAPEVFPQRLLEGPE
jgi:hypothetical protein